MRNPWLSFPGLAPGARALVRASWHRSHAHNLDPERGLSPISLGEDELAELRGSHPLARALPVIQRLLMRDAERDSGVLVAVGDAAGRLLWIDGDSRLRPRAESMHFMPGADWSEAAIGTSAPGTALALDHSVQIHRGEHFARAVHGWSCTAVPVHDPHTRAIIGVIDITGGDEVVDPHTLPLIEATALAVENDILVHRLRAELKRRPPAPEPPGPRLSLRLEGADRAVLATERGQRIPLSVRHTEILFLLAENPSGLSSERLAEMLYGGSASPVTLRAEMVRLRRVLADRAPSVVPESRPYRVGAAVETDAHRFRALLDRGAHRRVLALFPAPLMTRSEAPGIRELSHHLEARLRESMLMDASLDVLLEYAASEHAREDSEVWIECLRRLPVRSPKRAAVVEALSALESGEIRPMGAVSRLT